MEKRKLSKKISPLAPKEYIRHWPINHEQAEYMKQRALENKILSKNNPNENWMYAKLKTTDYKWSRQTRWGYRIFDFWCHILGIAVEVDGTEHNERYDKYRDEANYYKSGILVVRVRNKNEEDAAKALEAIKNACNWNERRISLQLKPFPSLEKLLEKLNNLKK